jgi:hypothetical protein
MDDTHMKIWLNYARVAFVLLAVMLEMTSVFAQDHAPRAGEMGKNQSPTARRTDAPPAAMDEELRTELLGMFKRGQAARVELVLAYDPKTAREPESERKLKEIEVRMKAADGENTKRLKKILEKYGWPGESLIGPDGAHAVFMMVQHSDADPEFQRRCLPLLKKAAEVGEAKLTNYAYLTDRVRVNHGEKQVYGTQLQDNEQGETVPSPLEDPANVDRRRAEIGLGTLDEYIRMVVESQRKFREKNKKP